MLFLRHEDSPSLLHLDKDLFLFPEDQSLEKNLFKPNFQLA